MNEEKDDLVLTDEQREELEETPPEVDVVINETVVKRAAALAALGATRYRVAKELKISHYYVRKIWKDELFLKTIQEIGDAAVTSAKATTKKELAKLAPKAVNTIEKNLDRHNLEAARIILRSLGLEQEKPGEQKEGGLTLILAGQKPEPQKATVQVVREEDNG